jgi:orotate phosphoribosyltransferase-like protein
MELLLPHLQAGSSGSGAIAAATMAGAAPADVVADLGLGSASYRLDVVVGPEAASEVPCASLCATCTLTRLHA